MSTKSLLGFCSLMLLTATTACTTNVDSLVVDAEATETAEETTGEPADEAVTEAEQAICGGAAGYCAGWPAGRCIAKCYGHGWKDTGAVHCNSGLWPCSGGCLDYGQCGAAASGFCAGIGSSLESACWGWRN
jgi:hypothetical protein